MRTMRMRLLLCAALLAAALMDGAPPPRTRSVGGVVTDRRGNVLKGAAVQLENSVTLDIISSNTRENGRYSFHQLSPDIDFELTAKYKRWFSKTKILSKFDSRENTEMNFEIPVE